MHTFKDGLPECSNSWLSLQSNKRPAWFTCYYLRDNTLIFTCYKYQSVVGVSCTQYLDWHKFLYYSNVYYGSNTSKSRDPYWVAQRSKGVERIVRVLFRFSEELSNKFLYARDTSNIDTMLLHSGLNYKRYKKHKGVLTSTERFKHVR